MIKKIINKKGLSHLEMILSFIIFIGFVLFLLLFLKPVRNKEISQTIIDSVQRGIVNELVVGYNYTSVALDELAIDWGDPAKNCFSVELDMSPVIVKDKNEIITSSEGAGGKVHIIKTGANFYTIYSSAVFPTSSSLIDCKNLVEGEYRLGLLRQDFVLAETKIPALEDSYINDYDNLKNRFNIPSGNNFGFTIKGEGFDEVYMHNQPSKISVISRDVPLKMLDNNNEIKFVVLNIQAW